MGSVHFQQDIMLEGLISGVNLTSLDAGVLKLDDTIWSPYAKLIFSAPNAVVSLTVKMSGCVITSTTHIVKELRMLFVFLTHPFLDLILAVIC